MRELLRRSVGAQDQVPAEQVRLVAGLLELVRVPGEPQADLGAGLVAGSADTRRALDILPASELREDVLEAVKGVFDPVLSLEPARRNVPNPLAVQGMHGHDDIGVQVLDLP